MQIFFRTRAQNYEAVTSVNSINYKTTTTVVGRFENQALAKVPSKLENPYGTN